MSWVFLGGIFKIENCTLTVKGLSVQSYVQVRYLLIETGRFSGQQEERFCWLCDLGVHDLKGKFFIF